MRPHIEAKDLSGKVCLVTGATAGIGKVTATALAAKGGTVLLVGRNERKALEVTQVIQDVTANPAVHPLITDFSDLEQVRELALRVKEQHPRLDVLVNNAGAFFSRRQSTPYGVEMTLLVNHLSPFLLTHSLLELLKRSPSARIVNVSSEAHKFGRINFSDLDFEKGYVGFRAYARSKLANVLFTYELARRLEGSKVTVNAVHPGQVATSIWRESVPLLGPAITWFMRFVALSPETGADNSIYLAVSPEVEGVTGKYFIKRQEARSSPTSYGERLARELWRISEDITAGKKETPASL